jgi:hypothetical protein
MADFRDVIVAGIVSLAAVLALLFLFGVTLALSQVVWLVFGFIILGFLVRRTTDLQIGFILIGFGLLLTINEYFVPDIVSEALNPVYQIWVYITGIELAKIEPLRLTILIALFVTVMIYIRLRLSGEKKFADTTADKTFAELNRYARRYITIGRLFVFFLFSIALLFMNQLAELLGELGGVLADAPVVSSNVFAILSGYFALGGDAPVIGTVPLLGDLTAIELLVLLVGVLFLAAAVKYSSSGPLSRALRQR